jgi:hypothetical protein
MEWTLADRDRLGIIRWVADDGWCFIDREFFTIDSEGFIRSSSSLKKD